ncbi:MAG: CHRD domain-containing protein [Gemmatimonadaceae bacterium]
MRFIKALLIATLTTASACGSYSSDSPYSPIPTQGTAQVLITLPSQLPMVSSGESRSAVAVVIDANGDYVNTPTVAWSSSAPAVATVTGSSAVGTITAVNDGTTTITASSAGVQQTVTITVHRLMTSVLVVSDVPVVGPGSTVQIRASARDLLGKEIPSITNFTYTTPLPGKIIVSPTGLVTALIATPSIRIAATATSDGVTITGFTDISVFAPPTFDFASLMLGDNQRPTTVPTVGEGVSYFRLNDARINYLVTWTQLSAPATHVQIRGPASFEQTGDVLVDLAVTNQAQAWGILNHFLTAADIQSQNGRPAISIDSLAALMRGNQVYVNVTTATNPNGELRGQIEGPFR